VWILQICDGLIFLHKNDIIHKNLKTSNIFFDNYGRIKIGDIGLTKDEEKSSRITKTDNIRCLANIILDLLTESIGEESTWKERIKLISPDYSTTFWSSLLEKLLNDPQPLELNQARCVLDELLAKDNLSSAQSLVTNQEIKDAKYLCENALITKEEKYEQCGTKELCSKGLSDSLSLTRHEDDEMLNQQTTELQEGGSKNENN